MRIYTQIFEATTPAALQTLINDWVDLAEIKQIHSIEVVVTRNNNLSYVYTGVIVYSFVNSP